MLTIVTRPFWERSSSVLQQIFFYLLEANLRDAPTQTGEIVMDISGIGVIFLSSSYVCGNAPQFFVRGKNPKLYNGAYGFFNQPKL